AIRELEDLYAVGGADSKLIVRIVEVSKRFSVLSRFTAFLAVDRSEKVNVGGKLHRSTQAVEPASGWDMLGAGDEELADEKSVSAVFADQPMDLMELEVAPQAAPAGPPMAVSGYAPAQAMDQTRARRAAGGAAPPPMAPAPAAAAPAKKPKPVFKTETAKEAKRAEKPVTTTTKDKAADAPAKGRGVSLVDRLRELRDQLAARGAVDPVALALVLVQELDAIARGLSNELRAALDRVRLPLRDAAAGRDPEARLTEAMSELEALITELEGGGPSRRREAFWK
ncbi:MAG TPA: hypothetical protein VIG06_29045, partial [Kofleriaceae bacterium]